jgi:hypothetical protein
MSTIEDEILARVRARGVEKTICPSEVARALWPADWRAHMGEVREVAYALQDRGEIAVTQAGEEVDGRRARGAIRLRLKV